MRPPRCSRPTPRRACPAFPGVAAVTAGPGITNTITALKNAQLAQSPVILLGGAAPTALQGRGALQDINQRPLVEPHVKLFRKILKVRDLGPAVEEAFAVARSGVPGPVFVECPVDLLYDEASIRQWYAEAAGKGKSAADRLLRFYLNRHVRKMFDGSELPTTQRVLAVDAAQGAGRRAARGAGRVRQGAAAADGDRQPGRGAGSAGRRAGRAPSPGSASRCTCRAWRAGCWGATIRCSCATSAARRCAKPTACCWPACPATSGSTTASMCGAAPR